MSISEREKVVQYLLNQITCTMMAKSPVKDALQKAAVRHEAMLKAQLDEEEYAPIRIMRDTVAEVVKLLVNCQNVDQLKLAHEYLAALNEGSVLIAKDNPDGTTTVQAQS